MTARDDALANFGVTLDSYAASQVAPVAEQAQQLQAQLAQAVADDAADDATIAQLRQQIADLQAKLAVAQQPGRPQGSDWAMTEDFASTAAPDDFAAIMAKRPAGKKISFGPGDYGLGGKTGYAWQTTGLAGLGGVPGKTILHDTSVGTTSLIRIDNPAPGFEWSGWTLQGSKRTAAAADYWTGVFLGGAVKPYLHDLVFRGWAKGTGNYPPQETFQLNFQRCTSPRLEDVEIDGRLPDGTRWAASPVGWNRCTGGSITRRLFAHHSVSSMPTHWACTSDATSPFLLEDVRCEDNGTGKGSLTGHGLNFEQNSGVAVITRPSIRRCTGHHVYVGADKTQSGNDVAGWLDVTITDPDYDPGVRGLFTVDVYTRRGTAPNLQVGHDPKVTVAGTSLMAVSQSPSTPTDPSKYFCRVT